MRLPLVLVVALLAAGCLEGGGPAGGDDAPAELTVRDLAKGQHSGVRERTREVIDTDAAWRAFWARHASADVPPPPVPPVDFTRERVLAVVNGDQPNGCQDVQVGPASRAQGVLTFVVISWDNESASRGCTEAITQPHHVLAVGDVDSVIRFEERAQQPRAEPLAARSLERGSFSGIHEDTRVLLRTQDEWDAFWARHRANGTAPRVEFPAEMVVAVVRHGPPDCFGLHVGNVTHDAAARLVLVEVVHERTPPYVTCIAALTDVYDFVAVPAREGEARFVETEAYADVSTPPPGADAFEPRTLARGSSSGVREPMRSVLRDEAAWRAFWANHTSNADPAAPLPRVDFSKEAVFAAVAGDRGNTCWALRVEGVEVREDEVVVTVATYAPPQGAVCGQMVTQPHHVVTYPRTDAPLRVVEASRAGPPPDV